MTLLAFVLVLFAAMLHAVWNFAAKKAAGNPAALWLGVCFASVLSWPFAALLVRVEKPTLLGLLYILATGSIHAGYFGFLARAYALGDISVVYPVARGIGVAGTAVIAWGLLHEMLSLLGMIGVVAICTGTGLVGLGQQRGKDAYAAYLNALLVGATIMGYSIVDKLGVGQVHPVVYISGLLSLAALFLAPYMLVRQRAACLHAYRQLKPSICFIGIGSMCTYLIILFAFRLGPVSYIVAVRELAVVIGAFLGCVFLGERLTHRKVLGIITITLGLVLVKVA